MIQTKICGISDVASLDAAVRHGASHIGFVFFPRSPRNVAADAAAALAARAPAAVRTVALFVDPDPDMVASVLSQARIDVIQLHGSESPALASTLGARHGVEVWKAVPVRSAPDLERAADYRGAADRIVYDAKPPAGADLPGGNGLRFDWTLLSGRRHHLPWILSGGLAPENVAEAVSTTGARFLDVSSGVERSAGIKDVDKIAAFLQSVASL